MFKFAIGLLNLVVVAAFATAPQVPQAARSELAPTGKLRAGINLGNVLLATKDPGTGDVRGVAVDLAREIGRRVGVPVEIVTYDTPGQLADAVKTGAWDIAFLAAEPARAAEITFTPAYSEIEVTYLVPKDSHLRSIAEVDREGVRIAVAAKTAFDLFLSRSLQRAHLIRAQGTDGAFKAFVADRLEALAGLRPTLVSYVEKLPGSRLLDGRFTAIQQAIGTPKARGAAVEYLRAFVEDVKASGLVTQAIEKHGVGGLSVAPIGAVQ